MTSYRSTPEPSTLNRYYNTPARLVVLIQEICNEVVRNACEYMGGENIWNEDPKHAASKVPPHERKTYRCFSTAAHRDKSREWNVSKQKWNLCEPGNLVRPP